jgi:hypothetical protein
MMTVEDQIAALVEGQSQFKTAIAVLQVGQKEIQKDTAELVVNDRQRNNRIGKLELAAAKSQSVMDTMKYLLPTSLMAAGVMSGIIFGVIQAVTN